jgi:single-stranded-DNA-specific exonuclease
MTPSPPETAWILPQHDRRAARTLATSLRVPGIVADVLVSRGITAVAEAQDFLETRHRAFSDPFALAGMADAVARIQRARDNNEHVRVFGDYDVDGMAATALMVRGLRRAGLRTVSHAMPNRIAEGYGINPASVAEAARDGVSLLITVDNGINAFDAADEARRLGVDLIVTDHHSLDQRLPDALAVINPHRDDPSSSAAFCCGAAVAFKLCSALNGDDTDLDLAALATVADVVPLRRENRLIVSRGVERIAARTHPGLEALVRQANLTPREVRAEHIAFQLAPRLNASGRISDGRAALQLMLTDSHGEAQHLAAELDSLNKERRAIEETIFNNARRRVEEEITNDRRTIVLAGTGWHPGVIGIVASKLVGAFGRPVMLIAVDENGIGRGSGRSTRDLHLADALSAAQDLLVKHGGHRLAAGLTIESAKVPAFAARIEEHARQHMPENLAPRELPLDAVVALSELGPDLINTLERLEPFGAENPAPVFGAFGVQIPRRSTQTLRGGHLRCTVAHESHSFAAIGFNLADSWNGDMPECADIAFRPRFNTWRGETTIQLQLIGLRPAE